MYCIVLYCIVLYCIVLYCIVLYCIVLYCIVLYCIVFISLLSCIYIVLFFEKAEIPKEVLCHFKFDNVYLIRVMRKKHFAYEKTKAQISAFGLATRIVQFLYFLYPKCQGSSHLL